jgi:hypothetical protein
VRALRLLLAAALALSAAPASAEEEAGRVARSSEVLDRPVYPNLEGAAPAPARAWCDPAQPDAPDAAPAPSDAPPAVATAPAPADPCAVGPLVLPAEGYRLSVDGTVLEGGGRTEADQQRCADVRLAQSGIRIQSDEHGVRKTLAVDAWPDRAWSGEPVDFTAYWNYSHWVHEAEIRLFPLGGSTMSPPLAALALNSERRAQWTPPPGVTGVRTVLRVYDAHGRFDETEPYDLLVSSGTHPPRGAAAPERELNVSYGKNHLALDRIAVSGAKVTVSGTQIKPESKVYALGREAPVSKDGGFAVEEILPPGRHDVAVRVDGPEPLQFVRPIYIAENRWFYIALADLTVGGNRAPANAALVTGDGDHYAKTAFVDGQAAFYLKGEVKGDWILTASADTREQPLNTVFNGLQDKDPQTIVRNLDPNRYYPVYGDDSTMREDAPTDGKFYVRLERGESKILWGNYAVALHGNELVQVDRTLYGGDLHLVSDATTKYGERKRSLDAYIGDPGTLSAREEFRGTGGSLFYVQHLDITQGSDLVTVETRDKDSGIVEQVTTLVRGQDYDIDDLQGRIVLAAPLASLASDNLTVQTPNLSGNPQFLVVRYEYQPGLANLTDFVSGGRASAWLGDHVEVGATGTNDPNSVSTLGGADATIRYTPTTYLKGEVAQSRGAGSGAQSSTDGGFNFNAVPQTTTVNQADAARVEGALALGDLKNGWTGKTTGYWKGVQNGFAGPGQLSSAETEQFGGTLSKPLPGKTSLDLKYDQTQTPGAERTQTMNLDLKKDWGEHWSTTLGARSDWRSDVAASSSAILSQTGQSTDVALRVAYDTHKRWSAYGYGQGTADQTQTRMADSRYGVGGKLDLTNRWSLTGEVSTGDGGIAAKVGTEAKINDRSSVYTNYQVQVDRTDNDLVGQSGTLVTGAKSRYTDSTTVFGEERWTTGTGATSLTHAYGLDIAEKDGWHWGLTGEQGTVSDPNTGDTRRVAATGSMGITRKNFKWSSAIEYRDDQGAATMQTWMSRNSLSYQVHPDWRMIAKFSLSFAANGQSVFYAGQYTEGVLGWAYRPVKNDRLNALFKYTYLTDTATPGQITTVGVNPGYMQRSHVVSADANYDLVPKLSIGGKYALKLGEVQMGSGTPWFTSTAHLFIVRLDFHVVRKWDAIVEGRTLMLVEARNSNTGALVALYRHLSKNFKVGGGYNFTNYSDDLTDLSYRSHGWFVNMLADF